MRIVFFESENGVQVSADAISNPVAVVYGECMPSRGDIVGIGDKQYQVWRSTWVVAGDKLEGGIVLREITGSQLGGALPLVPYSRRT